MMKTINVSDKIKQRFMEAKFEKMGKEGKPYTDEEFLNIILNHYEAKK